MLSEERKHNHYKIWGFLSGEDLDYHPLGNIIMNVEEAQPSKTLATYLQDWMELYSWRPPYKQETIEDIAQNVQICILSYPSICESVYQSTYLGPWSTVLL